LCSAAQRPRGARGHPRCAVLEHLGCALVTQSVGPNLVARAHAPHLFAAETVLAERVLQDRLYPLLHRHDARAHNALLGIEFRRVDNRLRAAPAGIKVRAHGKFFVEARPLVLLPLPPVDFGVRAPPAAVPTAA
jgi:hypothetical protein